VAADEKVKKMLDLFDGEIAESGATTPGRLGAEAPRVLAPRRGRSSGCPASP